MKTNLSEWLTRNQCFIKPKAHFVPVFSFKEMKGAAFKSNLFSNAAPFIIYPFFSRWN